jgi:hypothetical protein
MKIRGDVIGRQPWISGYSITGRGIDIILLLNIQQESIRSLIDVGKQVSVRNNLEVLTIFKNVKNIHYAAENCGQLRIRIRITSQFTLKRMLVMT